MKSQWECLLQNLGEWYGSFTRFSPEGDELEDTPTMVSFEGLDNNQTMRQIVRRFVPVGDGSDQREPQDKVLEYSSLGRGILLFENGAFSHGSIQLAPYSEFGAELGLTDGNRRLRLVQLFNREGQFYQLTLIREKLADAAIVKRPNLTLDELMGEWHGEAVTLYPDWRSPEVYSTTLMLSYQDDQHVLQQLTFGEATSTKVIRSTGRIHGKQLIFEQNTVPTQVLLLPDGASSTCPLQVKVGQPFFLEVGWLVQPDLRQRMVRRYNEKGAWVSLTLVTERRVLAN